MKMVKCIFFNIYQIVSIERCYNNIQYIPDMIIILLKFKLIQKVRGGHCLNFIHDILFYYKFPGNFVAIMMDFNSDSCVLLKFIA